MSTNPAREHVSYDPTAYRPAKEFMNGDYKAINKVLEDNPWIRRRKPNKQRLLIHAGDWQEYIHKKQSRRC
jgi:hypothetical protein